MTRSVLVVAPFLPLPADFGGAIRMFQIVKGLAERCEVSLLAPGTNDDLSFVQELGSICNVTVVPARTTSRQPATLRKRAGQIRSLSSGRSYLEQACYNPQMQSAIDRLFLTRRIDLVQSETPETALYRIPDDVPTVVDALNVEHELLARISRTSQNTLKSSFNLSESRKLRRLERDIWNRATLCIATSERDAALMRNETSTPVEVIPNGVDLHYFDVQAMQTRTPGAVVFTGAMRHQPNADAACWYAANVHPLLRQHIPEATFSIVGADPPSAVQALGSDSITVTGRVDDVRPWLHKASVVAVPLLSGGGTRLKILEAFAAGRPVVSTTVGAEGLDVEDGVHLLLADTPEAFARAILQLSGDGNLAGRLSLAGRRLVESRYDWKIIVDTLANAHERVLSHSG